MIAMNVPPDDVVYRVRTRILALIENHPEILESPMGILLELPDFKFRDLNPSMYEVLCAFHSAVRMWKAKQNLQKP